MKKLFLLIPLFFALTACSFISKPQEEEAPSVGEEKGPGPYNSIEIEKTGIKSVDNHVQFILEEAEKEVEDAAKELEKLESVARVGLHVRSELFSHSENIKSYKLILSKNTGGAHSNTFFHTWTYDASTGEIFKFQDLFQTEHNPLWKIYPIVKAQLLAIEISDEAWIERGSGDVNFENYRNFVIDGTDLVLLFEPYQVAAYAAGPQEIRIPLDEINVILRPPFLKLNGEKVAKPQKDLSTDCTETGGAWVAEHNECEYVSQEWCEQQGGRYSECESACRHNPAAEICTMQCVVVCEL